MIPVVLAGGKGTRFWPLSRKQRPKQFLSVLGDGRSLIQTTVDRVAPLCSRGVPLRIVCRPDLVEPLDEILEGPTPIAFVQEPQARNTAPAIALGALHAEAAHGDEPVAFFPADHFVSDNAAFRRCLQFAAQRARDGAIVTLGIAPNRPETGYGYIESSRALSAHHGELQAYPVEAFVEKPDHQTALAYLESGRFMWNAGIFVLRPSTLWREFRRQQPAMMEILDAMRRKLQNPDIACSDLQDLFGQLESISIDYAVMEGALDVEVVPALFRWSDVGHWGSLQEVHEIDPRGNVVQADALLDAVDDSVILSTTNRLIAVSGVHDLVVVDTDDALLVIPRERAQRVRHLVAELERRGQEDLL